MSELCPVVSCVVVAAPMTSTLRHISCCANSCAKPVSSPWTINRGPTIRSAHNTITTSAPKLRPRPYELFRVSTSGNPRRLTRSGLTRLAGLSEVVPIYENFKQVIVWEHAYKCKRVPIRLDGGARFCIL